MDVNTILLVEDDEIFAEVFINKLKSFGNFNVVHCDSVESGFDFIEHSEPELIFLDHDLGGMSGVDSIGLFQGALNNVEICIVSGQKDPKVLMKALNSGVKYFRKNSLLLERTEEFIAEVLNKPTRLKSFWDRFLSHYTNAIPQNI